MKIEAAVAVAPFADFVIETIDIETPRDDEVLVRVVAAGVCHTDLVFRDQPTGLALPAVFGHEGAGIVEAVGGSVTGFAVGDKVLMTFRSCGNCQHCGHDQPAYCDHWPAMNMYGRRLDGTTPLSREGGDVSGVFFGQSSFASHAIADESNLIKLDADAPLAIYAPLGCGIQTGAGAILRSMDCKPGSSLAIVGGGTVGLSAVLAAVSRGCAPIIVIDPLRQRREVALELGAHHAIDPTSGDVIEQVWAIRAQGVDYCLDSSGSPTALEATLGYLAKRGTLGLVGVPSDPAASLSVPLNQAMMTGLTVRGIFEGDSNPRAFIPELIAMHRSGRFPFDRLITPYPFAAINEAIADQAAGKAVKVVLVMAPEDRSA